MLSQRDRYIAAIDNIIDSVLKGQVASKELLYQRLTQELEPGTGEIFEQCLVEKVNALESIVKTGDESRQARATRQLRAIKLLQQSWEQWRKNNQDQTSCAAAVQQILATEAENRLAILLQILDPNQTNIFKHQQIRQLAIALQQEAEALPSTAAFELRQYATGLTQGLNLVRELEPYLVSWVYEIPNQPLGFGGATATSGPWTTWAKQTSSPLARTLFTYQAQNQSAAPVAQSQQNLDWSAWISLMVLMRDLYTGLVAWFDKQPYSAQAGRNLSGVTFLVFAMIWCELSSGFKAATQLPEQEHLAQVCFQIALQILRSFAQRDNFPLYGGVFASFSGEGFRETLTYLNQPLNFVENVQEKARILTVLGYSQRWVGNTTQALTWHQEALELARQVGDQACEVANLNHLSRLHLAQKSYREAIAFAQRALILARQIGDRKGEAYSLVSLGYGEVLIAQQDRRVSLEQLESSISYLQEGLQRSEKLQDESNQAISHLGLGIAFVSLEQPDQALAALEKALALGQRLAAPELNALSHVYLGEAHYQLNHTDLAIYHGCLGMYLLEQRQDPRWQKPGALVIILQGKLGIEKFQATLNQMRSPLIAQIGVDGFDYLPGLIERYREG